jgi:hypothetical protein
MKRPYDLRHSGITWRLDSGVPDAQVAAWAGHSVEMLRRVYAGRAQGLEGIWITRMNQTLPQDSHDPGEHPGGAEGAGTVPQWRRVAGRDQA